MTTLITHPLPALALGLALGSRVIPPRLLWLGAIAACLPDADMLAFRLGIAYQDVFGHRGFSHSLLFAGLCGLMALLACRGLRCRPLTALLWVSAAAGSHSLLDAMTNGGLGVAGYGPGTPSVISCPGAPSRSRRFCTVSLPRAAWQCWPRNGDGYGSPAWPSAPPYGCCAWACSGSEAVNLSLRYRQRRSHLRHASRALTGRFAGSTGRRAADRQFAQGRRQFSRQLLQQLALRLHLRRHRPIVLGCSRSRRLSRRLPAASRTRH